MINLIPSEFTHSDERRTLTQLFSGDIKQVNVYEAKKNSVLGNHYHKSTTEYFYISRGTVYVECHRQGTPSVGESKLLDAGSTFKIEPGYVHTVECMTDVTMLTFLSQPYTNDNPDTFKEEF